MEHITNGIEGKVVAITGASSGIGAATARLLSDRGASVVLGARVWTALLRSPNPFVRTGGRLSLWRPTSPAPRTFTTL